MKKTVKYGSMLVSLLIATSCMATLVACGEPKPVEYTVTYLDGTDVLKTEKVKDGEKAVRWMPTKENYTFVNWYATPNFSVEFPFDEPITENKSVFSQWVSAKQTEDTRTYYIVGSGKSPILAASNWGKVFDNTTKMTKTEGKNEYTYTCDLQVGDLFQFALNASWHNQRGVGYLETTKLADGTVAFSGASTIGDNSSYRLNIKCELAGNYTFTLKTHPDDDTYETTHASYTEANKEAFNINSLDKISWVRNGDVSEVVNVVTDYYIKGAKITNWKDMYNPATKMTNTNGVYTLETYLKENDEFMFTSRNTIGTTISTGTEYLRSTNLDDNSKQYITETQSKNMVAKATGTYTFTYTKATEKLSIAFDSTKTPVAADYYIDGTFAEGVVDWQGYCFNSAFKLAETAAGSGIFKIENVAMKADSQFSIQSFKAGSTERGDWGTPSYNGLVNYKFEYLFGGGDKFGVVGTNGSTNIKVLTAGTYNITFDSYAKMITIEDANTVNDAYIVGAMTKVDNAGWKVSADWKMTYDAQTKTYTITKVLAVGDEFGVRVMNGQTTTQKDWFAANKVTGSPAGFEITGSNIKCTTAGTYTITCTITDGGATISIVAAN